MITSVYLSNGTVRVVMGTGKKKKARIKKAWKLVLPEGCLINGIITNETQLAEELEKFWKENRIPKKDVKLVLEGSRLVAKDIEIPPKLKPKKILELLPREFSDIEESEKNIFDYMELETRKGEPRKIRGVSVEREYIAEFLELFKGIGVKVTGIAPGRSCVIHVLHNMKSIRKKTVVFLLLDGSSMTSVLCVDGIVTYSTQRRIFVTEDSDQFSAEIARSVSNLQQFQMTQEERQPIAQVYLSGISQESLVSCQESVSALGGDIQVTMMQMEKSIRFPLGPQEACEYLFPIGGLMPAPKEINLAEAARRKVKKKKESSISMKKMLLPPGLVLALFAGLTAYLFLMNEEKQRELDALNSYLTNEENVAQAALSELLDEENLSLERRIRSVRAMDDIIASYPLMNSQVTEKMLECARGYAQFYVTGYQAEDGLLSINASAGEVTKINQFIDRLQRTGLFERLDYTGYTFNEETLTYSINVSCYLAETAGK